MAVRVKVGQMNFHGLEVIQIESGGLLKLACSRCRLHHFGSVTEFHNIKCEKVGCSVLGGGE